MLKKVRKTDFKTRDSFYTTKKNVPAEATKRKSAEKVEYKLVGHYLIAVAVDKETNN